MLTKSKTTRRTTRSTPSRTKRRPELDFLLADYDQAVTNLREETSREATDLDALNQRLRAVLDAEWPLAMSWQFNELQQVTWRVVASREIIVKAQDKLGMPRLIHQV